MLPLISPSDLPSDTLERYRALRDPWTFLNTCVYTKDEVSLLEPVKLFPAQLAYVSHITQLWQRESLLVLVKSRRMTISWLMIALFLHDTIINTHRATFFISDKEEKADSLVERAEFIFDRIPRNLWPNELLPTKRRITNHLTFDQIGSSINAVASGADQLRQYTASGILMDEFGFWPKDQETFTAAKPTIQGGGRIAIISSPPPQVMTAPRFFWKLCYDKLDDTGFVESERSNDHAV